VQGSSYQPSSKGDENTEAFQDDVEIPFRSSTNEGFERPCLIQEPNFKSKVEFFFPLHELAFYF
jgi:hypothetical protein